MRKTLVPAIMIFIIFVFASCYRTILGSLGTFEKSVSVKKMSNAKKEVVFIPMHHIGKPEFYDDVKKMIDSLRKEGYTIYYEAVKVSEQSDSLYSDTLRRKMRQIIGTDPFALVANGGYIDTINHTILNKKLKLIKNENLINQRSRIKLGIDTTKDIWADTYLSEIIPAYEKKFGIIELTDCDFFTSLKEKYSCTHNKIKEQKTFAMSDYRNQVVTNKILKDTNSKIAVVYGAKHYSGLLKLLQQQDATWKSN